MSRDRLLNRVGLIASYRKSDTDAARLWNLAKMRPSGRPDRASASAHGRAKQLRPAEIADAALKYANGATIVELANACGIHREAMSKRLVAAGVEIRPSSVGVATLDREALNRAIELYADGLSLAKISGILGFGGTTIRTHLLRAGVQLRSRPGR